MICEEASVSTDKIVACQISINNSRPCRSSMHYNAGTLMELRKHGPGRPRKFGRPSRAVTVTLPEDVLTRLSALDVDLGRAIVSLVERRAARVRAMKPAEIASYGNHAVIIVSPVNALKRIDGVQ